jgi:lipopolysaccharide export system permease protein
LIIFRYIVKEVCLTLIALTAILMLIFLSNQFIQYLNRAASGSIPGLIIMKLMLLEIPNLLGLLLPLGFYTALLISFGRLYAENEMTILQASGYGPKQLITHTFIMATIIALLVGIIMFWASPFISSERARLLRQAGPHILIQTLVPGRFHAVSGGSQVFYVQSMNREHNKAEQIFLAKQEMKENKLQWNILWAEKAFVEVREQDQDEYLVLQQGREYQGTPGNAEYQVAQFAEYKTRLPHPFISISDDIRTRKTSALWPLNNPNLEKAAELQWRFSIPLMVFILTLIAIPLCRVSPRAGKFAKLLPAILIYIVYANLMFIARDALVSGKTPFYLGMWWIHLPFLLLGIFLLWRHWVKLA